MQQAEKVARGLYTEADVAKLGFLPSDWVQHMRQVVAEHGVESHLDGSSTATREAEGTIGVDLRVLDGEIIERSLPWLTALYHGALLEMCQQVAGPLIQCSPDVRSSINVNSIQGIGGRYEWHVDTNPLTGILYATTHPEEDGGELFFQTVPPTIVRPREGNFIIFDARELTHSVLPLKRNVQRLCAVMNYYDEHGYHRPADLDGYLYR